MMTRYLCLDCTRNAIDTGDYRVGDVVMVVPDEGCEPCLLREDENKVVRLEAWR